MKTFHETQNVGTSKYVVNFHDGQKQHADGSPFFDIRIFSNKREKNKFLVELTSKEYKATN